MTESVPTQRGSMMMMNDPADEPLYDPTQVRSDEELRQQLAALADPEGRLSKRALAAFAGLEHAQVQALQSVWCRLDAARRYECVQAMQTLMEDNIELDFRAFLFGCLNDTDEQVRATAIESLWEDESTLMLESLLRLVDDPAGRVRVAAVLSLSRFAYRASLAELDPTSSQKVYTVLHALNQDPRQPLDVRRRALEALGFFADQPAVSDLIDAAYRADEQSLRESALVAMGRTVSEEFLPMIELELRSPTPAMRYEAARAAGEMGELALPLLPLLLPMVDEDDLEIALAAIWALGEIGGQRAHATLQRLLHSNAPERREAAQEALFQLDDDA